MIQIPIFSRTTDGTELLAALGGSTAGSAAAAFADRARIVGVDWRLRAASRRPSSLSVGIAFVFEWWPFQFASTRRAPSWRPCGGRGRRSGGRRASPMSFPAPSSRRSQACSCARASIPVSSGSRRCCWSGWRRGVRRSARADGCCWSAAARRSCQSLIKLSALVFGLYIGSAHDVRIGLTAARYGSHGRTNREPRTDERTRPVFPVRHHADRLFASEPRSREDVRADHGGRSAAAWRGQRPASNRPGWR